MSNTIGWGKGSENNDIGWGQGAVNNNIGWGAIHELSYSGETNIVGGLADALAEFIFLTHKNRVEADGGVVPDYDLLKEQIQILINNYNLNSLDNFQNKLPVTLNPNVFGYKKGTGLATTLGQSCEKLYSINSDADVSQATEAKQPLLLEHFGDNYIFAPRANSNNAVRTTTSEVTSYDSGTDTLRFTAKVFLNNQVSPSVDYIFTIGSAGNFILRNQGANKSLGFRGTANALASSQYTPSATEPHWVRYTIDTVNVTYEWSPDGISWTGIGVEARPAVGALSATFSICNTFLSPFNAVKMFSALFENVTTDKKCTFTPNLFNRVVSETFWFDVDCNWLIQQSNDPTGLKLVMVDETLVIGDGISYKLENPSFILEQAYVAYVGIKRIGEGVVYGLAASSQLSNDGTNTILNNGTALNIANSSKAKQMITVVSNGDNSSLRINNENELVGNAGNNNGTYIEILANNSTYGTYIIHSLIVSNND